MFFVRKAARGFVKGQGEPDEARSARVILKDFVEVHPILLSLFFCCASLFYLPSVFE